MDHMYSGVLRSRRTRWSCCCPCLPCCRSCPTCPAGVVIRSDPNRYAEHLVYGAHLHAFAFLMIIAICLHPL